MIYKKLWKQIYNNILRNSKSFFLVKGEKTWYHWEQMFMKVVSYSSWVYFLIYWAHNLSEPWRDQIRFLRYWTSKREKKWSDDFWSDEHKESGYENMFACKKKWKDFVVLWKFKIADDSKTSQLFSTFTKFLLWILWTLLTFKNAIWNLKF